MATTTANPQAAATAPAVPAAGSGGSPKPAVAPKPVPKPAVAAAKKPAPIPQSSKPAEPEEPIGNLPDFIDTYVECHDVTELPREIHRAVAIGLIGAILNDKGVTIQNGALKHSMDLWQIILTGSGGGRSTAFSFAESLLNADDDWKGLIQKLDWASPQAMKQGFAENEAAFFMWGEFGEKMKKLNSSQFGGAKAWLTDRYDSFSDT